MKTATIIFAMLVLSCSPHRQLEKASRTMCNAACNNVEQMAADKCADVCIDTVPTEVSQLIEPCENECIALVSLGATDCVEACEESIKRSFDKLTGN